MAIGKVNGSEIVLVILEGQDGAPEKRFDDSTEYDTKPMKDRGEPVIPQHEWDDYTCWTDSRGRESRWKVLRPESRRLQDFPWQQMISYGMHGFRGRLLLPEEFRRYFREWLCHDPILRRFVHPCDYHRSYDKWLQAESRPYAWWADCFHSAMLKRHELSLIHI